MLPFIGRGQELAALEELYKVSGFQMAVVYGRRRVGKSTLLERFVSGKRTVFYTAVRMSLQKNVELLGRQVLEVLAPEMQSVSFTSRHSGQGPHRCLHRVPCDCEPDGDWHNTEGFRDNGGGEQEKDPVCLEGHYVPLLIPLCSGRHSGD